jgi:ribulose-bisphosphate carboxylase large chain
MFIPENMKMGDQGSFWKSNDCQQSYAWEIVRIKTRKTENKMNFGKSLDLSGDRFTVTYSLFCTYPDAVTQAREISIENTIEFPLDLLPDGDIKNSLTGKVLEVVEFGKDLNRVVISYPIETTANEFVYILNVTFGNVSMMRNVKVERIDLPPILLEKLKGPRFGRQGLREMVNAPTRPLLCAALKPLGFSPKEFAEVIYQFGMGGIDFIKEDHNIGNQKFAEFKERIKACSDAIGEARQKTGLPCVYIPNISGPVTEILDRAKFAKEAGAGGGMLIPGLVGLDFIRVLAEDDAFGLPIMHHPAFHGVYVHNPIQGFSFGCWHGQIPRMVGSDFTVYPNFGGRFSYPREGVDQIIEQTKAPMGHLRSIFPTPGGGMTFENIPEMLDAYGKDVVFLMGGGLFRSGNNLTDNTRKMRELVERV